MEVVAVVMGAGALILVAGWGAWRLIFAPPLSVSGPEAISVRVADAADEARNGDQIPLDPDLEHFLKSLLREYGPLLLDAARRGAPIVITVPAAGPVVAAVAAAAAIALLVDLQRRIEVLRAEIVGLRRLVEDEFVSRAEAAAGYLGDLAVALSRGRTTERMAATTANTLSQVDLDMRGLALLAQRQLAAAVQEIRAARSISAMKPALERYLRHAHLWAVATRTRAVALTLYAAVGLDRVFASEGLDALRRGIANFRAAHPEQGRAASEASVTRVARFVLWKRRREALRAEARSGMEALLAPTIRAFEALEQEAADAFDATRRVYGNVGDRVELRVLVGADGAFTSAMRLAR